MDEQEKSGGGTESSSQKRRRSEEPQGARHPLTCSEADFACSVCTELLLDPIVAPCGHDMCSSCFRTWQKACGGLASCPICRGYLPMSLGVCLRLKNTIEALHPEASKRRRKEVQMRQEGEGEAKDQDSSPFTAARAAMAQWASAQMQAFQQALGRMPQATTAQQPGAQQPQQQPAEAVAMGMPVLGFASDSPWPLMMATAMQTAMQQQQQQQQASARSASPAPQHHRWQAPSDSLERLQVARAVARLLQSRGLSQILGEKQLAAVRVVELLLYRAAPSKECYMDMATLEQRIAQIVRQREREGSELVRARRGAPSPEPSPATPRAATAVM